MTDPRTSGPAYDPTRPRPLTSAQAEDVSFYSLLGRLTIGRIQEAFAAARMRATIRQGKLEAISHDEALTRLGYKPDAAAVRVRAARAPALPKPVEQKRKWWQR